MDTITSVEKRRGYTRRYDIKLNGEYAFTLEKSTLDELGYEAGGTVANNGLPPEALDKEREAAMSRCLYFLGRREHSTKELMSLMSEAGFDGEIAEAVTARLTEMNYLDDARFAEAWAESKLRNKSAGQVKRELKQKGVSGEIIEDAVEADPDDEFNKCLFYAKKYIKRSSDANKARRNASQALFRRGYDWDTIKRALDAAFGEENESGD